MCDLMECSISISCCALRVLWHKVTISYADCDQAGKRGNRPAESGKLCRHARGKEFNCMLAARDSWRHHISAAVLILREGVLIYPTWANCMRVWVIILRFDQLYIHVYVYIRVVYVYPCVHTC
jgi:hypothetical protein